MLSPLHGINVLKKEKPGFAPGFLFGRDFPA